MNNNEIFLEFWRNYQWPNPAEIFYRLYHDDHGNPLIYTMEDLPGNYIDVTAEQYTRSDYGVRVIDGRIQELARSARPQKIKPAVKGTPCHPRDISIVVHEQSSNQPWSKG